MFPSIFVIAYMIFIIFMNYRKHHLRNENQKVYKCTITNSESIIPKYSFDKYDASILMDHHVLM